MQGVNKKERITRREIFERSSAAFATAGVLAGGNTAKAAQDSGKKVDAALTTGKIALEEHFGHPDIVEPPQRFSPEVWREISHSLEDIGTRRIAEMDRGRVEFCILSLTAPGIQAISDVAQAITLAPERTIIWPSTSRSILTV